MKTPIPADVLAAWNRGDRIEAIKALRERTGLGLQEAKYMLESGGHTGTRAYASSPSEASKEAAERAREGTAQDSRGPKGPVIHGAARGEEPLSINGISSMRGRLAPGEVPRSRVSASTGAVGIAAGAAALYFIYRSW